MGKAKIPHDKTRPESPSVKKALATDDIEMLKGALTYRQRRFCEEYVLDFNGSAAAVRSGYSPKYPDRQASMLLNNKGVVRYVDHLTQSAAVKAFAVDPDYVLKGIVNTLAEATRAGDKFRGYELLARILGMMIEKKEVTGKDGGPIEIEETRKEADEFTRMLKSISDKAKKEITVI